MEQNITFEREEKERITTRENLKILEQEVESYFKELDEKKLEFDINKDLNLFINNYFAETHGRSPSTGELLAARYDIYIGLSQSMNAAKNEKYYHNNLAATIMESPLVTPVILAEGYVKTLTEMSAFMADGGVSELIRERATGEGFESSLNTFIEHAVEYIDDKIKDKIKDGFVDLTEKQRKTVYLEKMNDRLQRIIEKEVNIQNKEQNKEQQNNKYYDLDR